MSSVNSPCAQIDSIKGLANQLKVEAQAGGPKFAKVEDKLTQVSDAVKTGDPKKASSALDTARAEFQKAQVDDSPRIDAQTGRKLEAYA